MRIAALILPLLFSVHALAWWNDVCPLRIPITISAGDLGRPEYTCVDVPFDSSVVLRGTKHPVKLKTPFMRLMEVDAEGNILDSLVPFQYDPPVGSSCGPTVSVVLVHGMDAGSTKRYHLYLNAFAPLSAGLFEVTRPSYNRIIAVDGRYTFLAKGAGFSAITDKQRNNWIGYDSTLGSSADWRGLPCLAPNKFGHPAIPGPMNGLTIASEYFGAPAKMLMQSFDTDTAWQTIWQVYPTYASMEIVNAAEPYWFVYGGTPGGTLETSRDFVMLPDGTKRYFSDPWVEDIVSSDSRTEWLAVGDDSLPRVFFMVNHTDDTLPDAAFSVGSAAVIGFGRGGEGESQYPTPYLTGTGKRFSVGFVESKDPARIAEHIRQITEPATATVGKAQTRPFEQTARKSGSKASGLRVIVKAGEHHRYRGMGFNMAPGMPWGELSGEQREVLGKELYEETGFNTIRIWPHWRSLESVREMFVDNHIIGDAVRHGVGTVILIGTGRGSGQEHAEKYVAALKSLRADDVPINAVSIWNKPNTDGSGTRRRTPETVVEDIKIFHKELAEAGLEKDVKLVAPETVEWWPRSAPLHAGKYNYQKGDDEAYLKAVIDDPDASACLHAFGLQSYGKGMTKELGDQCAAAGKEMWITLSATDPLDPPHEWDDEVVPTVRAATCLSDLNLGASLFLTWTWHQLIDLHPALDSLSKDEPIFKPTHYFLRNISSAIDPGAAMRKCVSDPPRPSGEMDFNYTREPDIVAAAAQNPDGSWMIGLVNLTGVHSQHYESYFDANEGRPYRVSVFVEELAKTRKVAFSVTRTRSTAKTVVQDGRIVMKKGRLKAVVKPLELMVLKSEPLASRRAGL